MKFIVSLVFGLSSATDLAWSVQPRPPTCRGERGVQRLCGALGLALQALTPAMARQLRITDPNVRGLVVSTVDPNSDADQKGIQAGDIILSINQATVPSVEAAVAAIEAARRAGRNMALLLIRRGNAPPAYFGVELARAARSRPMPERPR